MILPAFESSFTLSTVAWAALNSSLLCIKLTFDVFDNSKAQSSALSPPPKIDTVLPSNIFLSLIEYKIVLFSNCSHSLGENFLGSKDPTPPAIITFGVSNSVPLLVFTFHFSLSFFNSSTLSPKWNLILKGFNCSKRLLVNSSPVHSGIAGIS